MIQQVIQNLTSTQDLHNPQFNRLGQSFWDETEQHAGDEWLSLASQNTPRASRRGRPARKTTVLEQANNIAWFNSTWSWYYRMPDVALLCGALSALATVAVLWVLSYYRGVMLSVRDAANCDCHDSRIRLGVSQYQ